MEKREERLFYRNLKRVFDLFASLIGLILLSPGLLLISFIIFIYDHGPVFYRAERTGRYGRPFRMFKFRSMVVDADKKGPSSASTTDSRITPFGKILRKYKLDELPQLFNVFMGEMSIVGPRPEVKKFTDMYTEEEKAILSVKPGITDWASLWNSNEGELLEGSDDPDLTYVQLIRPEKIQLQLKYVNDCNFLVDLKILMLTLQKVLIR
jgi:lipopolysaccharide/colanic/teichoic acid biosynthesis glycosyltransferase